MSDINPPCSTCNYFKELGDDGEGRTAGECRRKSPPVATINAGDLGGGSDVDRLVPWAIWPRVFGDAWCGDHSALAREVLTDATLHAIIDSYFDHKGAFNE
jgi:hypothetical protein